MTTRADPAFTTVTVAEARAAIAERFAPRPPAPTTLGSIVLTPAQAATAQRGADLLATWGGVLLADATGSGKTYIALAIAQTQPAVLIIAPAALRETWTVALGRAGISARFVSIERLGRGPVTPGDETMLIIDEAHHLRNPSTKRFRHTRALCQQRPVILLSATPLHNRPKELTTLLSLFLGDHAADLSRADLGALVLRSADASNAGPPVITHPPRVIRDEPTVTQAICALPPPVPAADGGVALALWHIALLRAWCSSSAALAAMLRRAALTAAALEDAADAGRRPTRHELRALRPDDGQLAWPLLLSAPAEGPIDRTALRTHRDAITSLRTRLAHTASSDSSRAAAIRAIMADHPGIPVLACTQYAATVDALWHQLRTVPGVAALTASGGRIASGRIARQTVLEHFAPTAQGVRPPPSHARVMLLLTTDIVSEGLNLQDAGVIIHLDTPWTPARLTQREGRLARPGSPHPAVHAYQLHAARSATTALALERRLRTKRQAAQTVDAVAAATLDIRRTLLAWRRAGDAPTAAQHRTSDISENFPIVAALPPSGPPHDHGQATTAVAHPPVTLVCLDGTEPSLLADIGAGTLSDEPEIVAQALRCIDHAAERGTPDHRTITRTLRHIRRRLAQRDARRLAEPGGPHAARLARPLLTDLRASLAAAAPHQRTAVAAEHTARMRTLATPRSGGAQRLSIFAVLSSFER